METKSEQIRVVITPSMKAALRKIAAGKKRSFSWAVQEACAEYIKKK